MTMFSSLKNHRVIKILFFTALALFLTSGVSLALSPKPIAQMSNAKQSPVLMKTDGEMPSDTVPGEILVKFSKNTSAARIRTTYKSLGAEEAGEAANLRVHRIRLPKGMAVKDAIAKYKNMPGVEYVEPEYRYFMQQVPNDAYYGDQWALPIIKAPQAWDVTTGGEVIVAVVDTGVDYSHEDLAGKVIKGYDYVNNDNDPMDDHYHGTHVAGTIAGVTNNGIGIAGVSWGAKILAVKVLDASGTGTSFSVAQGIRYAADYGAKIINLSLGGPEPSATLSDAIAYAHGKGCIIVAAAGNEGTDAALYPAAYQNVIGVGATGINDLKASYSNYGWYVDVAAPGGDGDLNIIPSNVPSNGILSCYLRNSYAWAEGTSMAAPHVAGLAALIASRYPGKTGDQLARSIMRAVDDLGVPGRDDIYGYGRINAEKAVTSAFVSSEETGTYAVYSGSWSVESSANASGGTYAYSSSTSDSVTYTFNGTGVTWVARKHPAAGIAKVYIDSVYQQDVDLYGNDDYQQLAYTKTGLLETSHTIEVEVAGTKNASSTGYEVNVDAFDVASLDTTAPVTTITASPASPDGSNGWYLSEPTITLTANETATIYYRWDGGADTTYTTPFIAPTGTHTLTVHAIDLAGNAEVDHNQQFKVVDITPPGGGDGGGGGGSPPDIGAHDSTDTTSTLTEQSSVDFKDIMPSHWAYSYILDLARQGIIKGYADDTFRPSATVTRAEFAKMICLAMGWPLDGASRESFSDVAKSSWTYSYVETARAHGAISGYPDGTFKPNKNVTRAEIAKIIAETLNLAPGLSSLNSKLNDIDSSWAGDYIKACVKAGIVGGYADNNFRPANTASRAEAAKMIVGVLAGK